MNKHTYFNYEYAHQGSKFLVKQFSTFNIAHLSKFVVNFNLIVMSKSKYIQFVILTDLFCSVVASCTSHFYSSFSVNDFGRSWFLVWQLAPLGLAKPRPKTTTGNHEIPPDKTDGNQWDWQSYTILFFMQKAWGVYKSIAFIRINMVVVHFETFYVLYKVMQVKRQCEITISLRSANLIV